MRGVAEANWSMRFLVSLGTSSAIPRLNPEENQKSNIKSQNEVKLTRGCCQNHRQSLARISSTESVLARTETMWRDKMKRCKYEEKPLSVFYSVLPLDHCFISFHTRWGICQIGFQL